MIVALWSRPTLASVRIKRAGRNSEVTLQQRRHIRQFSRHAEPSLAFTIESTRRITLR
jgi:hypothetical protein